ncbi:putative inorganic phosphate cotransporter [Aplysia californica]|uniref:Inorganic phosphate cotransporter n=1 Tax=Aplysia californica TaxID=6500 RepID=A0ABM1VZT1_APLCA|nr:putative inorganic phosphate cotransporter [Aplysia californica]
MGSTKRKLDQRAHAVAKGLKDVPIMWSSRMWVTFMCFWGITIVISLRYNMSMAIVCMVNHTAVNAQSSDDGLFSDAKRLLHLSESGGVNGSANHWQPQKNGRSECGVRFGNETVEHNEDGPLLWSKETQGFVLSSYFWGYVGLQLVSGWVVGRVGSRYTLGLSVLAASVACVFIPVTAMHSVVGTMVLRAFIGFVNGVAAPAVHNLLSNWAPAKEISTLGAFAYAGHSVGGLGSNAISGLLCKYGFAGGWPSVFYVFGLDLYLISKIYAALQGTKSSSI